MNKGAPCARRLQIIARLAHSFSTTFGGPFVVRGSVARGDFCRHSDIDLVLIGRRVGEDERLAMLEVLQPLSTQVGRRLSLVVWNDSTPDSLDFWLGASEGCFVAGDRHVLARHRLRWQERLRALPIETLFRIRADDPRRSWYPMERDSPLGMNLKRARGGFIDTHFVSLLCRALRMRDVASDEYAPLFRESARIAGQLLAIRSALHAFAGATRESAWFDPVPSRLSLIATPARTAALMDRQQAIIDSLERRLVWKIS